MNECCKKWVVKPGKAVILYGYVDPINTFFAKFCPECGSREILDFNSRRQVNPTE